MSNLEDLVLLLSEHSKEVAVSKMYYIASFKIKFLYYCSDVNK